MTGGELRSIMQDMIEEKWAPMPKEARGFLLETPLESLTLQAIARFWSSAQRVEYVLSLTAGGKRETSLPLALTYLSMSKVKESRALLLNGAFLLDCMASGPEIIFQCCAKNDYAPCTPGLKHFSHVFYKVKTPQAMDTYIHQMLNQFHTKEVENFVRETDYFNGPPRKNQGPSDKMSKEAQIQLILDDANTEEQTVLMIGSSTNLKTLFNNYAEKRGVSLRSLRFSYDGKILFLSSAGNKTPDKLNMKDHDVISVYSTNGAATETINASSVKKNRSTPKKNPKTSKKSRKKGKGNKEHNKQKEATKTLEDHRADHSKLLSDVHAEVQSQLKEIRTRLNARDLERQPPKQKKKNRRRNKAKCQREDQTIIPKPGIGGKAGKPCFSVLVGEVQNLYKTTKSPHSFSCNASSTLDLHGCTIDEALEKLDGILKVWVDAAMQGSYPFVRPHEIVCGCGNQVLSETVEKWICKHAQVANSPKRIF